MKKKPSLAKKKIIIPLSLGLSLVLSSNTYAEKGDSIDNPLIVGEKLDNGTIITLPSNLEGKHYVINNRLSGDSTTINITDTKDQLSNTGSLTINAGNQTAFIPTGSISTGTLNINTTDRNANGIEAIQGSDIKINIDKLNIQTGSHGIFSNTDPGTPVDSNSHSSINIDFTDSIFITSKNKAAISPFGIPSNINLNSSIDSKSNITLTGVWAAIYTQNKNKLLNLSANTINLASKDNYGTLLMVGENNILNLQANNLTIFNESNVSMQLETSSVFINNNNYSKDNKFITINGDILSSSNSTLFIQTDNSEATINGNITLDKNSNLNILSSDNTGNITINGSITSSNNSSTEVSNINSFTVNTADNDSTIVTNTDIVNISANNIILNNTTEDSSGLSVTGSQTNQPTINLNSNNISIQGTKNAVNLNNSVLNINQNNNNPTYNTTIGTINFIGTTNLNNNSTANINANGNDINFNDINIIASKFNLENANNIQILGNLSSENAIDNTIDISAFDNISIKANDSTISTKTDTINLSANTISLTSDGDSGIELNLDTDANIETKPTNSTNPAVNLNANNIFIHGTKNAINLNNSVLNINQNNNRSTYDTITGAIDFFGTSTLKNNAKLNINSTNSNLTFNNAISVENNSSFNLTSTGNSTITFKEGLYSDKNSLINIDLSGNTTKLTGNINSNQYFPSNSINLLTNNIFTGTTINLNDGAIWENTGKSYIDSFNSHNGIIRQNGNDIFIDNYNGNTTIHFEGEKINDTTANIKGGTIYLNNVQNNSSMNLIMENPGIIIDQNNFNNVYNTLDAMANKIHYLQSLPNNNSSILSGTATISEGLITPGVSANISFDRINNNEGFIDQNTSQIIPPQNPPSPDDDNNNPIPPSDGDSNNPIPPSDGDNNNPIPPSDGDNNNPIPPSDGDNNNPVPPSDGDNNNPVPPSDGDNNNPVPPSDEDSNTTEETPQNKPPIIDNIEIGSHITSTMQAMRDISTVNIISWRQENSTLREQLYDLQNDNNSYGLWSRFNRGEFEYNNNFKNQYNIIQIGYDKFIDDSHYGIAFSHNDANTKYKQGNGKNNSNSIFFYRTHHNDIGEYNHTIFKAGYLNNIYDIYTSAGHTHGDYNTWATSLSHEYGKKINLSNKYFITPQAEMIYTHIWGTNYNTNNNIYVSQDNLDSLVGRIGVDIGTNFNDDNTLYLKASLMHEFTGTATTKLSLNNITNSYQQDIGNTWYEFGIGTNIKIATATYFMADITKTFGDNISTPWQYNLGLRWNFF